MPSWWNLRLLLIAVALAGSTASCHGNYPDNEKRGSSSSSDSGTTTAVYEFVALPPAAYTNKVKSLLTGSAATGEEIASVVRDGQAISSLLDQWMQTPAYRKTMQNFFTTMLQQSLATGTDYTQNNIDNAPGSRLQQNLRDSMALTALHFADSGTPFTQIAATQQFMMTTAMMSYYAFLDTQTQSDNGAIVDTNIGSNANYRFSLQSSGTAIPWANSVNPADPNFMVFNFPPLKGLESANANCLYQDPFIVDERNAYHGLNNISSTLMGVLQGYGFIYQQASPSLRCYANNSNYLTISTDYSDWRMVSIRQPNAGDNLPLFFDIPSLRGSNTLALKTPRIGFFTTPAFLAQWYTNPSNQARVTINQTLIAALSHGFDGTDTVSIPATAALDQNHANNAACFSCHQNLDPMRQFFRHDYTIYFSPQTDSNQLDIPPTFAFDGVSSPGSSIYDLGNALAAHPRFAIAWAQKLCNWANSAPCSESDPEFQRVAGVFAQSNFSWPVLVKAMMTSPLVTYSENTQTATVTAQLTSLARREQFCALIDARLGLEDFCGLSTSLGGQTASVLTSALPTNLYSRGVVETVLVTTPDLMYRSEMENLCAQVAAKVVDAGATSLFRSTSVKPSIATMVGQFMGLSGVAADTPNALLTAHYASAVAAGATATQALKSTFITACLSPYVTAIGI